MLHTVNQRPSDTYYKDDSIDNATNLQKIWRPIWVPDHQEDCCLNCKSQFNTLLRRHHCRGCGNLFCNNCTSKRQSLPQLHYNKPVRICNRCSDLTNFSKLSTSPDIKNREEAAKGFLNLTCDSLGKKMIIRGFLNPLGNLFTNGNPTLYKHLTKAISNLAENDIVRIDILEANFLTLLVNYLLESFKKYPNLKQQNKNINSSNGGNSSSRNNNSNNNNNNNNIGSTGASGVNSEHNNCSNSNNNSNGNEEDFNNDQFIIHDDDFESFLNVCLCFQYLSCEENILVKTQLADRCLPILIKMSRSYNVQIKHSSSIVLLNLVKNPLSRDLVVQGGGIGSLIAIAINDDAKLQETSAHALSILSAQSKYQRKVVECGALPPLVLMLNSNSSSDNILQYTTSSLSLLAENQDNQIAIVQVGGINPLKNILIYKNEHTMQISYNAALTLYHLSTNKNLILQLAQHDLVELLTKIIISNYNNPSYDLLLLCVKIIGNLSFEKEIKVLIRKNQSMMNILRIMVHSTNRIQQWAQIIFNNCETGQN
ncbi:hypothetical protein DICPUDRAFT_156270 [Dictyostelium purpureum]|uniref:FYVE-type domain-containing protein n=1 Tax=Dictyostelium purpureum TaxID=5786 RepID=F0ZW56_DICPU|nr:uncharacterized protein DICPUDRAFT_156270 [Dictyostelium purpureum]EGC31822.1 hypothetical protein DICPUDRAFT_156270 [Dictyostelium purpureum]|eukprot:XP_003291656.1 hypothetical protein DICPUDRAFT_156270 [Dictyostelium purpureum]